MSYAGVESDSEYAQRRYGLTPRKSQLIPEHCGDSVPHTLHQHGLHICTGNLAPAIEPGCGKHKAAERVQGEAGEVAE